MKKFLIKFFRIPSQAWFLTYEVRNTAYPDFVYLVEKRFTAHFAREAFRAMAAEFNPYPKTYWDLFVIRAEQKITDRTYHRLVSIVKQRQIFP